MRQIRSSWAIAAAACLLGCGSGEVGFGSRTPTQTVEGAAHMTLSAEAFDWVDVEVGKAESRALIVTSTGENTLKIKSWTLTGDDKAEFFTTQSGDGYSLGQNGTAEIQIVCNLTRAEPAEAFLRLETNDADRPVVDLPLTATPLGWAGDTGDTDSSDTDP